MSSPDVVTGGGSQISGNDPHKAFYELQLRHRRRLEECVVPGIGSILAQVVTAIPYDQLPASAAMHVAVYRTRQPLGEGNDGSIEQIGVRLSDPENMEDTAYIAVINSFDGADDIPRPFQPSDAEVLREMVDEIEFFGIINGADLSPDLTQIMPPNNDNRH